MRAAAGSARPQSNNAWLSASDSNGNDPLCNGMLSCEMATSINIRGFVGSTHRSAAATLQ